MSAMQGTVWIGIDVGKTSLDVVRHPDGIPWQVANDADGWQTVVADCQTTPPAGIVLEATGGYETGVVVALDAAGFTPVVANPIASRRFAQSLGRRGKSDRLDAALLAAYGAQLQPVARPVPSETARKLRALIDRREQLTKQLVEEQNRLQQADPIVRDSLAAHLVWLRTERDAVTRTLDALVASDPFWQHRVALLETVPGMGRWTATVYAVELPELADRTGKQLASLVGSRRIRVRAGGSGDNVLSAAVAPMCAAPAIKPSMPPSAVAIRCCAPMSRTWWRAANRANRRSSPDSADCSASCM